MPAQLTEIKKYEYRHWAKSNLVDPTDAIVYLYDSGDRAVANLIFKSSGALLPPSVARDGRIWAYFSRSFLPDIVDMLRNEKPVYFSYDAASNQALVDTLAEPVGEGETIGILRR